MGKNSKGKKALAIIEEFNKIKDKKTSTNTKTYTPANASTYGYKKEASYIDIRKNETICSRLIDICKLSQKELTNLLPIELQEIGYENIVCGDGYIYAKGEVPILLTAHMDTVHVSRIVDYYEGVNADGNHVLYSPQGIGGDDRCGIYMILEIAKTHKCSILFCEDEECGGRGSRKFTSTPWFEELKELKYMIELDRANAKDAVFYSCDNKEFTKFICDNTGYKETYGSFSDISTLAPMAKVAAVNLSCGYHSAHTLNETIVIEEMMNTIDVVKKLLDVECEQFEYIRKTYSGGYSGSYNYYGSLGRTSSEYYYGYGRNAHAYGGVYDDEDYYYGYNDDYTGDYGGYGQSKSTLKDDMKKTSSTSKSTSKFDYSNEYDQLVLYVLYEDAGEETEVYITGETKHEVWHKFFKDYPSVCYNDVLDYSYDYV